MMASSEVDKTQDSALQAAESSIGFCLGWRGQLKSE